MKEYFKHKEFRKSSILVIAQAIKIIEEYAAQGFVLTLRQLYYQFVARGWLGNTVRNYKRLGAIVSDARLAGLIDWRAIEDRTRNLRVLSHWDTPGEIIESASRSYRLDRWESQENYVEVWIEKEALAGVIQRVCDELDIPFFACRGYVSQSEQYAAGKRLAAVAGDRYVTILHLGDHDPSGIDMTRDNDERLAMFSRYAGVDLKRLALNMDQVEEYEPPPNPAKITDSRFESYVIEHGDESWELDALDPNVLERLIRDAVDPLIDWEEWNAVEARESEERDLLKQASDRWPDVVDFLRE